MERTTDFRSLAMSVLRKLYLLENHSIGTHTTVDSIPVHATNHDSPDADQMGDWGFGLGTLSFASDYVDGGAYQDGGLGNVVGIATDSTVEIEGSYGHYTDSTLESSRNRLNRPIQLVGQVHPYPDSVVSPFVSGYMEQYCDR